MQAGPVKTNPQGSSAGLMSEPGSAPRSCIAHKLMAQPNISSSKKSSTLDVLHHQIVAEDHSTGEGKSLKAAVA